MNVYPKSTYLFERLHNIANELLSTWTPVWRIIDAE